MVTVLIDHNIEGQADLLWTAIENPGWAEALEISFLRFSDIGLPHNSPDRVVWRLAQQQQLFLLTDNRNKRGDDSLEQTLRDENTVAALPVITIRNVGRLGDPAYREACASRLLGIILYPEDYRGTARQFIP